MSMIPTSPMKITALAAICHGGPVRARPGGAGPGYAETPKTSAAARMVKIFPLAHRYGVDVTTSPDHTARPARSALPGALDVAGASALARYRAEHSRPAALDAR